MSVTDVRKNHVRHKSGLGIDESRECCSQNANSPAKRQRQGGGAANEYEPRRLTNQMEFLGLTVNTVRLIVKSTSRVNIYYYLPDQLHPMVTFSIDIKNTQKVKNAQQQQLYEIRAMQ